MFAVNVNFFAVNIKLSVNKKIVTVYIIILTVNKKLAVNMKFFLQ